MTFLPYTLIRVANTSVKDIQNIVHEDLSSYIEQIIKINNLKITCSTEACDLLFYLIGQTEGDKKVKLLNLRRDIYNSRENYVKHDDTLNDIKDLKILNKIKQVIELNKSYRNIISKLNLAINNYIYNDRNKIKISINNDYLKKGLLLSSNTLLNNLIKYQTSTKETLPKEFSNIETGALKYLTRMCTKTTPFSTFTTVGIEKLKNSDEYIKLVRNRGIKSRVKIEGGILNFIINTLFSNINIISKSDISINRSNFLNQKFIYFYTKNEQEQIQRLRLNSVLNYLINLFQEEPILPYTKMLNLIQNKFGGNKSSIQNYVNCLIQCQLIQISSYPDTTTQDWCNWLINFLKKDSVCYCNFISPILNLLREVNKLLIQYESAAFVIRLEIVHRIKSGLIELLNIIKDEIIVNSSDFLTDINIIIKQIEETINNITNSTLLNEDTVSNYFFFVDPSFNEIRNSLKDLVNGLPKSQMDPIGIIKTTSFFLVNYFEGQEVDFLEFYNKYSKYSKIRNITKEHLLSQKRRSKLSKTFLRNYNLWDKKKQQVATSIYDITKTYSTINDNLEVNFGNDFLKSIQIHFGEPADQPSQYGAFLQIASQSNSNLSENLKTSQIVVNSIFPGYGRLFSRFLPYFKDDVLLEIQNRNNDEASKNNEFYVENDENSSFNANFHPLLTPCKISLKGGGDTEHRLYLNELAVRYNKNIEAIELIQKSDKKVCRILDLSFQAGERRSSIFKFLSIFNKSLVPNMQLLLDCFNDNYAVEIDNLDIIPRIIYNENLILQRKTWRIKNLETLMKNDDEAIGDFFVRVNTWRLQYKIPTEVFISVSRQASYSKSDDYKPQYFNFNSPLLYKLLDKITRNAKSNLLIQEVVPAMDRLISGNKSMRYVSEILIQWSI